MSLPRHDAGEAGVRSTMKRPESLLLMGMAAMMLTGCWVALPTDGPPGAEKYVGRTYTVHRDINIVSYWITPNSWEVGAIIGRNQEILATLKVGDQIKIVSIKSFRVPSGVHYAYRCIDVNTGRKFDLGFSMLDCIGLSKNLGY